MPSIPECGGEPINAVMAMSIGPDISLTLIRSAKGYCFCAWSRGDGGVLPELSDEHKTRPFPTPDEAAAFFRSLIGL